eukprot:914701-Prymnesium_polylepis.1
MERASARTTELHGNLSSWRTLPNMAASLILEVWQALPNMAGVTEAQLRRVAARHVGVGAEEQLDARGLARLGGVVEGRCTCHIRGGRAVLRRVYHVGLPASAA